MTGRQRIGIMLYGIAVTLFFLYWLCPSVFLERHLAAAAERRGMKLSVQSAALTIPPGMRIEGVRISCAARPDVVIVISSAAIRPKVTDLLQGRLSLAFQGAGYGGTVEGKAAVKNRFALSGPIAFLGRFDGVDLGQMSWIAGASGHRIKGTLAGTVEYSGETLQPVSGSGRINLFLSGVDYHFAEPFLGLSRATFDRVDVQAELAGSTLTVGTLNLLGKDLEATLAGSVAVAHPPAMSRIALRGSVSAPPGGLSLPVNLGGTLARPLVRTGRS